MILREKGLTGKEISGKLGFTIEQYKGFIERYNRNQTKISVKYGVIYRRKDKYSISQMCRFFKVSRSGYYNFVKRMNVLAMDLSLVEKIKECEQETNKTYGYRRVWLWLEREGIHYNPKTVLRVMQKCNLLSVVSYKTSTTQNNRLVLDTIRIAKRKEKSLQSYNSIVTKAFNHCFKRCRQC